MVNKLQINNNNSKNFWSRCSRKIINLLGLLDLLVLHQNLLDHQDHLDRLGHLVHRDEAVADAIAFLITPPAWS